MEGKERSREERQGEIRLNRKPVPRIATQAYIKCFIITLMKPYSIGSYLSGTVFLFIYSYVVCKKQRIRTHPQLGISSDYLCLNTADNLDTTANAVQKAVQTVTLNFSALLT